MFRAVLVFALALAATALLVTSLWGEPGSQPQAPAAPRVQVVAPKPAPATSTHTFTTTIRATSTASLAFTRPGRLTARPIVLGQQVARRQVLATQDPEPLDLESGRAAATLRSARAQLEQQRREVARAEALLTQGAASDEEAERARSTLRLAQAHHDAASKSLAQAKRDRAEATLRSPFEGVVTDVLLGPGDVASAGQPVVVISGAEGALEAQIFLPESLLSRATPGLPLTLHAPLLPTLPPLSATLTFPAPHAHPQTGLFPATIVLPRQAPGWRPGITAKVRVQLPAPAGWLLPPEAVIDPAGRGPQVTCVRGGVARAVPVTVLELRAEGVVVQGELSAGDHVVRAGHFLASPGQKVEVVR